MFPTLWKVENQTQGQESRGRGDEVVLDRLRCSDGALQPHVRVLGVV